MDGLLAAVSAEAEALGMAPEDLLEELTERVRDAKGDDSRLDKRQLDLIAMLFDGGEAHRVQHRKAIVHEGDDPRSVAPMRAWGCRKVNPNQRPSSAFLEHRNHRMPNLPQAAACVDPEYVPKRACGGHSQAIPYHQRYGYYGSFSAAGRNALTSHKHNLPLGNVPTPDTVFQPKCVPFTVNRMTKKVNTRPKAYATTGTMTNQ
jgi:hypothetical protein